MDSFSNDLDALQAALRSLFQTMKRPQQWAEISARAGVTLDRPAGGIIQVLAAHDGMRIQDIATALGIEAPSATRKSQELEQAGYVERQADPKDRRAVCLQLTAKGQETATKLQAAHRDILGTALTDWTADERQSFIDLLNRFATNIRNNK